MYIHLILHKNLGYARLHYLESAIFREVTDVKQLTQFLILNLDWFYWLWLGDNETNRKMKKVLWVDKQYFWGL